VIIDLEDLMSFNVSLTNVKFKGFSFDSTYQIVDLVDTDHGIFRFRDFKGQITGDYHYLSDPPVFADIGDINFIVRNLTLSIDGKTSFAD